MNHEWPITIAIKQAFILITIENIRKDNKLPILRFHLIVECISTCVICFGVTLSIIHLFYFIFLSTVVQV